MHGLSRSRQITSGLPQAFMLHMTYVSVLMSPIRPGAFTSSQSRQAMAFVSTQKAERESVLLRQGLEGCDG